MTTPPYTISSSGGYETYTVVGYEVELSSKVAVGMILGCVETPLANIQVDGEGTKAGV